MGVQLNIKDPETVRLARELAGETGRSVTDTVRAALQRAIAEREADIEARMRDIQDAVARFRENMPAEWHHMTSKQIMDSIYNEDGSFAK